MIITEEENRDFEDLKSKRLMYNQFKDDYNKLSKGLITANITAWYGSMVRGNSTEVRIDINSDDLSHGVLYRLNDILRERLRSKLVEDIENEKQSIISDLNKKEELLKTKYSNRSILYLAIKMIPLAAAIYFMMKFLLAN